MQDSSILRPLCVLLCSVVSCASPDLAGSALPPASVDREQFPPFEQEVPGAGTSLSFVPVAVGGGVVYASATEVSWEAYDAFVFALDGDWIDAEGTPLARPSTPYINVDRGFGHRGWPALSVSLKGAKAFCRWLSSRSGRSYRLPTRDEWLALARQPLADDQVLERAGGRTRAVGSGQPNAWGVHDAYGNVAEWVRVEDARHALAGGSYQEPRSQVGPESLAYWDAAWNQSDPQVPKSVWWLADAPFAGFRVVCEAD